MTFEYLKFYRYVTDIDDSILVTYRGTYTDQ
jgi:hypothetical protein